MNTNATHLIADRSSAVAAPLHIVIAHDHPSIANAAREMLASLLNKCAPDVEVHRDEWSFVELEHPQCRAESLELARPCDLFVVALTGVNDLPESFCEWLNDWVESRAEMQTALILCVSNRAAIWDFPQCRELTSLAAAHGLSFFATAVSLANTDLLTAVNPKTLLARLSAINPDFLPEISGINE